MPIELSPVKPIELPALRRLFVKALKEDFSYFPSAYTSQIKHQNNLWRLTVSSFKPERIILVARSGGRLVGYIFASVAPSAGARAAHIYWLYVRPEGRGQHIGGQLLHAALDEMRRQQVGRVTLTTYNQRPYYEKFGFKYHSDEQVHGFTLYLMEHSLGQA